VFPKSAPIIAVRRRDLFESAEWVYELKHDGFRALTHLDGSRWSIHLALRKQDEAIW
jgi:ATP-dependent DNA ligase